LIWNKVDEIVSCGIEKAVYPGAVVLIGKDTEVLYKKAYGFIAVDDNIPTTLETVYDIASMSKVVATTSAIMLLVSRGELSLWDTLGDFFDVPKSKKEISIFHLLTHTSGMQPYSEAWRELKGRELLDSIISLEPESGPMEKINYSCLNFITLMAVVEKVTSIKFDKFCSKEIFEPLGMSSTTYLPKDLDHVAPTSERDGKVLRGLPDDLGMGGVSNYFSPEEAGIEGLKNGMDYLTYCHVPEIQRRVKKYLTRKIERFSELEARLQESLKRVESFRMKAVASARNSLDEIFSSENQRAMQEISDKSITAVLDDKSLLPLPLSSVSAIYSVRLSRLVQVEDGPQRGVPAVAREIAQMVDCPVIDYAAGMTVEEADKLALSAPGKGIRLVFTENAHLHDGQREFLIRLSQRTGRTLVIALRNPYDAFLKGVNNCVLSYGYEGVSQRSILKVIKGRIAAEGKLPVSIPQEV